MIDYSSDAQEFQMVIDMYISDFDEAAMGDDDYYGSDAYDWWYDSLADMNIIMTEEAWVYLS
jgi:hypothetical protein